MQVLEGNEGHSLHAKDIIFSSIQNKISYTPQSFSQFFAKRSCYSQSQELYLDPYVLLL
jgi:hypothetical protein